MYLKIYTQKSKINTVNYKSIWNLQEIIKRSSKYVSLELLSFILLKHDAKLLQGVGAVLSFTIYLKLTSFFLYCIIHSICSLFAAFVVNSCAVRCEKAYQYDRNMHFICSLIGLFCFWRIPKCPSQFYEKEWQIFKKKLKRVIKLFKDNSL